MKKNLLYPAAALAVLAASAHAQSPALDQTEATQARRQLLAAPPPQKAMRARR